MSWVSLRRLQRFYDRIKENYYKKNEVDDKLADIDVSAQIYESLHGSKLMVLSQADYDALTVKDPDTIYCIYEEI
jgi:hypothetical protein